MTVDETLRAIDGALSAHPERFLADGVEFVDRVNGAETRGAPEVAKRLRELAAVGDVHLTVDVARGAAEWEVAGQRPVAAIFDVEGDRVTRVRLYAGNVSSLGAAHGPLTERERAVAALVASGLNNSEVAEALVVTRKTVEYHLRNIFRKLGVSNRTQLASMIGRLPT